MMAGCPHGMSSQMWCAKCQSPTDETTGKPKVKVNKGVAREEGGQSVIDGKPYDRAVITNNGQTIIYEQAVTALVQPVPGFSAKKAPMTRSKFKGGCRGCGESIHVGQPIVRSSKIVKGDKSPAWVCIECFEKEGGAIIYRVVKEAANTNG